MQIFGDYFLMDLNEFFVAVETRYLSFDDNYRYGQALYDELAAQKPRTANAIRGTQLDPFYIEDTTDPKLTRCLEFIEENWK